MSSSPFSIILLSYRFMNEKSLSLSLFLSLSLSLSLCDIALNFLPAYDVLKYLTKLSSLKYSLQFPTTQEFH